MGAPQYPNTLTVSESVQRTARDLRARIDELTGVAVDAGMARIPLYAGGGEDFGRAYRAGTEQALRGFLDFLEGRTTGTSWREAYRAIGAREHRAGRSLESLHAAIRIGARMGWRQLVDFAAAESLPISAIGEVADAIWAYVDELVDAAAEGYAQAREAESGELERRRLRLLELLVADPPASEEALVAAATAARWQLPRRLAVVAVDREAAQASRPVLPPDVLVDLDRPEAVLIVPDADSRAQVRMLVNSLRGYRAAVGPSVPPGAAGNSMRWARRALDLARRGVLASEELVWCQRHLAVLTLFQDEALLESFVECRLRPLRRLRESQRGVLGGTMLAWLQHGMNATAVATALHVHVQTVRRRLRQLDQLFGEQIEDPVLRFELQLALWADRVRRGGQPGHGPDTGHYTGD